MEKGGMEKGGMERGWRVVLDPRTRRLHGGRVLLSPTGRLLRLSHEGPEALQHLAAHPKLALRLVDAGAAHPVPAPRPADDVTTVIPVKDRTPELARCLAAVTGDVLVVDDGSADPRAVRALCEAHGARYVHRAPGGPAAARNTALPLLDKDFVAFLDSDCVPPPGWVEALRGHFDDPGVAAVAPRVTGGVRSPLDLGTRPGAVRPRSPLAYVPTAALLFRRAALTRFDEQLRYGEDVDLIWRTVAADWEVRYDPRVVVHHAEPTGLPALVRRFRYGTSAAALAVRHPDAVTHLVAPPWPTAAVALLVTKHPVLAAGAAGVIAYRLQAHLDEPRATAAVTARSVLGTAEGLGRALSLLGPAAWALAVRRPRTAVLLTLPWVLEQRERRPEANPLTYSAQALLDQAAYGAGVLVGCLQHRSARALRPRLR